MGENPLVAPVTDIRWGVKAQFCLERLTLAVYSSNRDELADFGLSGSATSKCSSPVKPNVSAVFSR